MTNAKTLCAALLLTASSAIAQSSTADVYSAASLEANEKVLLRQAVQSANGSAAMTLEKYPGHFSMLMVRTRSGSAEVHARFADIFVVLNGEATLVTGGALLNRKENADGEASGTSVQGGIQKKIAKGDLVHIAASVPHQLLITPGSPFTYFVVKVQQ